MRLGEADTREEFPDDLVAEQTLKTHSGMQVQMSDKFENQFKPQYLNRIFPYALNYECGGPE